MITITKQARVGDHVEYRGSDYKITAIETSNPQYVMLRNLDPKYKQARCIQGDDINKLLWIGR